MKLEALHPNPLETVIGLLQSLGDAFLGWVGWLFELLAGVPVAVLDWLGGILYNGT